MRWALICGIVFALHGGAAKADITVQQYREFAAKAPRELKLYIGGLQEGFGWAQAFYTSQDKGAIFCLPDKGLPTDEGFDILKRYIEESAPKDDALVGLLFMRALSKTFPCPKK